MRRVTSPIVYVVHVFLLPFAMPLASVFLLPEAADEDLSFLDKDFSPISSGSTRLPSPESNQTSPIPRRPQPSQLDLFSPGPSPFLRRLSASISTSVRHSPRTTPVERGEWPTEVEPLEKSFRTILVDMINVQIGAVFVGVVLLLFSMLFLTMRMMKKETSGG